MTVYFKPLAIAVAALALACVDTNPASYCLNHPEVCSTQVSAVVPNAGPVTGNVRVTLEGQALDRDSTFRINDVELQSVSWVNNHQVIATLPPGNVGPAKITVTNLNGTNTFLNLFTYYPASTVTSVSPPQGMKPGGYPITVRGTNLHLGTKILIGGIECTDPQYSPTRDVITATVPAGTLGMKDVRVVGPGGDLNRQDAFEYVAWGRLDTSAFNDGGSLREVVRGSSATLYALTGIGLAKSSDDGASWVHLDAPRGNYLTSLTADPNDPQHVLVITDGQVQVSFDGGQSFVAAHQAGFSGSSISASAIAVRGTDGAIFAASYGQLFKSTDGGRNFSVAITDANLQSVYFLFVHPQNPNLLIGGGYQNYFRSEDGGQTATITQSSVSAIAPGRSASEIFLVGDDGVLMVSNDGGVSFAPFSPATPNGSSVVFVDPGTGKLLVGSWGGLWELTQTGTWNQLNPANMNVQRLAVDNAGRLLVVAYGQGLSVRTGPTTFADRNNGLHAPQVISVAIDPYNRGDLYIGTSSGHVYRTSNDGASWTALPPFPLSYAAQAYAIAVSSDNGTRTLYVFAGGQPMKMAAGAGSWTADTTFYAYNVYQDLGNPAVLMATNGQETWFKAADGTWTNVTMGLPTAPSLGRGGAGLVGGTVRYYVIGNDGTNTLLYQRALGEDWTPAVGAPLPATSYYNVSFGVSNDYYSACVDQWFYTASPGAAGWTQFTGNQNDAPAYSTTFVNAPSNRSRMYAFAYDVKISDDGGRTWRSRNANGITGYMPQVAIDPLDANRLYVAANERGILYTLSGGE